MNIQRPAGYFLVLEEEQPSFGAFCLLQCNTSPKNYMLLLQLDAYQSECFRVWLEHRWSFPSLLEAEIEFVSTPYPALFIRIHRVFDNEEQASVAFKAWVANLLADKAKQRSLENA